MAKSRALLAARTRTARAAVRSSRTRVLASGSLFGVGGYEGARAERGSLKNWRPRIGSPDADTVPDLEPLRARTRDLARNAPLVAGALDTKLTCMIGPGLIPHPRIDRKFLGLTDQQADEWQAQASRLWWAFAGTSRCDIRRRANFAHLSWIAARTWLTSGDVFVRRRHVPRTGDLFGLKLQLIEADRVSNPNHKPDTLTMIEGVEMDQDGAPIAFHIMDQHPGNTIMPTVPTWIRQPAFGPKSGEPLVLHVGLLERDGQTRPVSVFAPVIEAIKQLTRYAGAELDAAVVTSFISAVIQTNDDGDTDILQSMGEGAAGPAVGLQAGAATAQDSQQVNLAPAAVIGLRKGETLASFNPNRPNSGFEGFFRAFCSIIGVAVGLPHELLIKHFTSSYSASRGALIEAWRTFKTKRSLVLIDQFAQPVYEWVITEAIARGYLDAPGFFTSPLARAAYLECQWSGPIMGQLNPQQEVAAAKERVDMGVSTLEEETAELTGGDDWERKHDQRVKEHRLRVEAGLEPEILGVTSSFSSVDAQNQELGAPGAGPQQDVADAEELKTAEQNKGNTGGTTEGDTSNG